MAHTPTIDLGTELAEGPRRDFNTAREKSLDRFEQGFELANAMQRAANACLIEQKRPHTTQRHTYQAF